MAYATIQQIQSILGNKDAQAAQLRDIIKGALLEVAEKNNSNKLMTAARTLEKKGMVLNTPTYNPVKSAPTFNDDALKGGNNALLFRAMWDEASKASLAWYSDNTGGLYDANKGADDVIAAYEAAKAAKAAALAKARADKAQAETPADKPEASDKVDAPVSDKGDKGDNVTIGAKVYSMAELASIEAWLAARNAWVLNNPQTAQQQA